MDSASYVGTSLTVFFNEDLANAGSLANSAFEVKKTNGGTEGTVTLTGSPSISGRGVSIQMSEAVGSGDSNVKVKYTKPTSGANNKLADKFGNEVATFEVGVPHSFLPAPRNFKVLGGDEKAVLTWDAPANASRILRYQYRHAEGATVPSGTAWQRTDSADVFRVKVTGLTNGTAYAFEVRTLKATGESSPVTATATPQANSPATMGDVVRGIIRVPGQLDWAFPPTDSDGVDAAEALFFNSEFLDGYTMQWVRVDGGNETDIPGATRSNYTLTPDDMGKQLKLRAGFEDDRGNAETVTSAAFPTSGTILETAACPAPTYVGGATQIWTRAVDIEYKEDTSQGEIRHGSDLAGIGSPAAGMPQVNRITQNKSPTTDEIYLELWHDDHFSSINFDMLALHVCDKALRFADASRSEPLNAQWRYTWDNPSGAVKLFEHASRRLYISRDEVAPTLQSATLEGTSLILDFSEDLGSGIGSCQQRLHCGEDRRHDRVGSYA